MLTETELEQVAREICPHCKRGYEMQLRGEKGHTLRFRDDTKEFVHDFIKAHYFEHCYCAATGLRKLNGR